MAALKMSAHSNMLDFRIPLDALRNPALLKAVQQTICTCLMKCGPPYEVVDEYAGEYRVSEPIKDHLYIFTASAHQSHAVLRLYPDGFMSLDIQAPMKADYEPFYTEQDLDEIQRSVNEAIQALKSSRFPPIKRNPSISVYYPTRTDLTSPEQDNLLIEYDFEECLYEADSPYQNIKIMRSPQFGNMLLLDNDPNLAESDLVYTQTITGSGSEDYSDKTVLILGGGDGGILHELLKENPKHILMVDIDEKVVKSAPKYLRGICGDSLDNLSGPNYQVLIEDCIPVLKQFVKEGRVFDYVINDLTAIPCSTEARGDIWDFLRLILDLSMTVLAQDGKYFTQGNGYNRVDALKLYEEQLMRLSSPVDFRKKAVYVPSYMEKWVFYEVWKTSG